jgi:Flp pilus assembly protein TadD
LITRLVEKGHLFIMDSKDQARTKAAGYRDSILCRILRILSVLGAKDEAKPQRTASRHEGSQRKTSAKFQPVLVTAVTFALVILVPTGLIGRGQQPVKPATGVLTRPRNAGGSSKISAVPQPRKPANASSFPSNDPQQLLAAGQAAQDQGRFDEAIRLYNRVVTLSTNQSRTAALAHLKIGNAYMVQGKFGNAAVAFERAVALNPADAESQNNLGEALGELKQYPRAIEAFNKAISLDPKLLKAKYNQAVSYDRMGNFRYSEFVFRSLMKSNPAYSLSYDGLAVTLSKAGRAKEAIAYHEKAIALDPREPSYYYNYALSYLMLGNTAKALEQQEKLKAIDPVVANRLASVIVKHQM